MFGPSAVEWRHDMYTPDGSKPLLTLWCPVINCQSRENNYPDMVSLTLICLQPLQTLMKAGGPSFGRQWCKQQWLSLCFWAELATLYKRRGGFSEERSAFTPANPWKPKNWCQIAGQMFNQQTNNPVPLKPSQLCPSLLLQPTLSHLFPPVLGLPICKMGGFNQMKSEISSWLNIFMDVVSKKESASVVSIWGKTYPDKLLT